MRLEGSCHCGAVRFSLEASAPVPFLRCYCSICRKTAGGGGYAINLGANADSLSIEGKEHVSMFHAVIDGEPSPAEVLPRTARRWRRRRSASWARTRSVERALP
jgi:hypothetical protein